MHIIVLLIPMLLPSIAHAAQTATELQAKKAQSLYVDHSLIRPGQIRISRAGIQAKIDDALKAGYIKKQGNTYISPKFPSNTDHPTSIIPADNPLPVVLVTIDGKDWMILLDGHHDYAANQAVGGTTVYVEVKDDLRNIAGNAIWTCLENKHYIYTKNLHGENVIPLPTTFDQLEDDPYRYFVKLAMWECKNPDTPFEQSKPGAKGLMTPLAVKWKDKKFNPREVQVGSTHYSINPAFAEFAVADLLYKYAKQYGFDYAAGDEKDIAKFQLLVEKARTILIAHAHEDGLASKFNVIKSKEKAEELIKNKTICAYMHIAG